LDDLGVPTGHSRPFAGTGRDVGVTRVETIASPRVTRVRYAMK